jgi:hypothetical protein
MTLDSSTLSVREGLIRIVSAERFQAKPQAGENVTVIIMRKSGGVLHYYGTMETDHDKFSLGEQIWGNFTCYVVDRGIRQLALDGEFATMDKISNVQVKATITYQVVDPKLVAIGVDDALSSFREELSTLIKREISHRQIDRISESEIENLLQRQDRQIRGLFGIALIKARVNVDLGKEVIAGLRQDRDRQRSHQLELEDINHVDELLTHLGIASLPADARLKLLSMPRTKAYEAIGEYIQTQRAKMQDALLDRAKEEYALLQKMIDRGILEDFQLQDLGSQLLERYSHMVSMEDAFGVSPSIMLGGNPSPRKAIGSGEKRKEERKRRESSEDELDESEKDK